MEQFGKRAGIKVDEVPHRTTVELMARELGVISDVQSAKLLVENDNLTIGFDATTQEGLHANSIHVTSRDKCFVLAVDQLPGGTAEDYQLHINDKIDSLSSVYCQVYSTNFNDVRETIISHISNTMTDRAALNHATIEQWHHRHEHRCRQRLHHGLQWHHRHGHRCRQRLYHGLQWHHRHGHRCQQK